MPLINYRGGPLKGMKRSFRNACGRGVALIQQNARLRAVLPNPDKTILRLRNLTLARIRNAGGRELVEQGVPHEILAAFFDERLDVIDKKFPRSAKVEAVTVLEVLDRWDPSKLN